MFDKTSFSIHPTNGHAKISIERAPTDESVRLLKEFEEEAKRKIEAALHLEGNELKGLVQYENSFQDQCHCFHIHFELNGKRLKLTKKFSQTQKLIDIIQELKAQLAAEIAMTFLIETFTPVLKNWKGKFYE